MPTIVRFAGPVALLLAGALTVQAAERVYHGGGHNPKSSSEIIYDLTVPWPFKKSTTATTTTHASAAMVSPTATKQEVQKQLLDTGILRVSTVQFATDKWELTVESNDLLDTIGLVLLDWPTLKIEIAGHADARHTVDYNQRLSERRAHAVRSYLLMKYPKLDAKHLVSAGYGEMKPLVPNTGPENWAKNRRVEFTVLNPEELERIAEAQKPGASR